MRNFMPIPLNRPRFLSCSESLYGEAVSQRPTSSAYQLAVIANGQGDLGDSEDSSEEAEQPEGTQAPLNL